MPPVKAGDEIKPFTCSHDWVQFSKGILKYTIICRVCGYMQYVNSGMYDKFPAKPEGCTLPEPVRP